MPVVCSVKGHPLRSSNEAYMPLAEDVYKRQFFPRARGTRVEGPGGIDVEGST